MFNTNNILNKFLIFSFISLLTSCGGGGGSNTPAPPATDTTPPRIIKTKPSSEESGIVIGSYIVVSFDEEIATVTTNQVTINLFVNGQYDIDNPIVLNNADSFFFNTTKNELEVQLKPTDLKSNSRYRVTINSIKNLAGISLADSCQWEFTTVGAPAITTGKTGVCSTDPDAAGPGEPKNVNAVAGDGSVAISWQAPSTGSAVSYYKIEKSTDNAKTFSVVDGNLGATVLSYTDSNAQNGTSHIYRVSAGNDAGISTGVNSKTVTPVSSNVTVVPGAPQNVTAVAGDGTVTINWTAPITGDTVAFYNVDKSVNGAAYVSVQTNISAATLQHVDANAQNGASHVYRVIAGNTIGLGIEALSSAVTPVAGIPPSAYTELISQVPGIGNYFGQQMAFSPDGNIIVIGEYLGDPASAADAGTAQIFTKTNGIWIPTQVLNAQNPTINTGFGHSVAFSPDGLTLAVGGLSTNSVDIYTRTGSNWGFLQTLQSSVSTGGSFGISVAFHLNSNVLAIGDYNDSPNGITGAGSVQLFTKSGTSWGFSQLLNAQLPAVGNGFGSTVKFSPDGNTLAVSEPHSSSSVIDAGSVQLFTYNGTKWVFSQVLVSKKPTKSFRFGGDSGSTGNGSGINFSPNSNTLAVGEWAGNNVQLFTRSGLNWIRGQVLTVPGANGGFGKAVAYSADGTTLAVGESQGISNGVANVGNVYLFSLSGGKWSNSRTLTEPVPTTNIYFGYSLAFSPVRSELAIGQLLGDTAAAKVAGVVWIINLSQLP